jgi:molecular chaperone HscB
MQIFKDRSKTLGYFLRLKGFSEDKDSVNLPAEFLMEMMEMNESLDDGDLESCRKRMMQWEVEMDIEFDSFVEGWRINPDESTLHSMKIHYLKQKYLRRILERLDND